MEESIGYFPRPSGVIRPWARRNRQIMNTSPLPPSGPPLDEILNGTTESVSAARTRVRRHLDELGADTTICERAELIVSELATNAVEASPGQQFRLVVEVGTSHQHQQPTMSEIVIRVENPWTGGPLPGVDPHRAIDAQAPRGRGLHIVRTLCDSFRIEQQNGTVQVVAALTYA
jgi:anti-sigma regulatory factor (Ser/Thr protein kinase)